MMDLTLRMLDALDLLAGMTRHGRVAVEDVTAAMMPLLLEIAEMEVIDATSETLAEIETEEFPRADHGEAAPPCHSWRPYGETDPIYSWFWRSPEGAAGWIVEGRCPVCGHRLTVDGEDLADDAGENSEITFPKGGLLPQ